MRRGESGRYQKSPGVDAGRLLRRALPLLALLTSACAPVDAQQRPGQDAAVTPPAANAPAFPVFPVFPSPPWPTIHRPARGRKTCPS